MSEKKPAPDEKLCPFCAETIKAAAIKCRYCGSDLDAPAEHAAVVAPPAPLEVTPEKTAVGQSVVSAPAVPEPVVSEPGRPRIHGLLESPLTTIALVLLIALASFGVWLVAHHAWHKSEASDGQVVSEVTRSVRLDQVSRATATVLSYRAATFDADSKKAQALMTASMKTEYLATLDKVRASVEKYKLDLTAKVASIGLISATDDRVKALAFINQTTTAKGSKNTQVDQNRAVVTMDKTAVGWRISSIAPF